MLKKNKSEPNPEQAIDAFIDFLMQESGFHKLPADFKITYRRALSGQVVRRIGILMLKELNNEDIKEFSENFMSKEKPDHQAMHKFLLTRVQNFEAKMKAGLDEFAKEFLLAAKRTQTA